MTAIVPYSASKANAAVGAPHKVRYRTGNTKATGRGQHILQMLTGLNLADGHVTLEDAQKATYSAEYYALQAKLLKHIKKKYGDVLKQVSSIEEMRAELQKLALDKDAEIAQVIAELSKANEQQSLGLKTLQHATQGEIGVLRAQATADMNVKNADFKTRLQAITQGQTDQVSQLQRSYQQNLTQQRQRALENAQRAKQSQMLNQTIYQAMNNPSKMPASRARGIFQAVGKMLR